MKRLPVSALLWSALVAVPASAEPMPLHPDMTRVQTRPHDRLQRHDTQRRQPAYVAPAPLDREHHPRPVAASSQVDLGGGFIEFLFGGGRPVAPPRPQPGYDEPRHAALDAPARAVRSAQPGLDPKYLPQVVPYHGTEKPGTIVIDTPGRFLFLVQEDGTARRYGIGVGRPGFTWAGMKTVTAKKEWPDWVPPPEMLKRQPELPTFMAGGPDNPLGARALYLGSSLYRIHGSNEPWTIGQAVSSGCIRMRNEDVMDLYTRVRVGTQVRVI